MDDVDDDQIGCVVYEYIWVLSVKKLLNVSHGFDGHWFTKGLFFLTYIKQ